MKIEDRLLGTLQTSGLTYYGAKAYITLLSLGPSGGAAIAEESGIPRSKVYDVLKKLARDGWITSSGTRPLRYRARDPREVMGRRKEALVEEIDAATAELRTMYDGVVEREPPNAWMVRGGPNIANRVGDMLRRSREEVLFLGALYLKEELAVLRSLAPELHERGVRVRILTRDRVPTAQGTLELMKELSVLTHEIRAMRTPMIKFIIADGREIMIMFSPVVGEVPDLDSSVAIWMPRSEVAALMRSNFHMMWDSNTSL